MLILCNTLLPNDRTHATPAEIGNTIKPTAVIDKNADVVVAPILASASFDSQIDVNVLQFFYFFFELGLLLQSK